MKSEKTLPLVASREEINRNVATLDGYLENPNSREGAYAKGLIGRGRCFVVVSVSGGCRFYPSRFMGYVDNSMEKHEEMGEHKNATGEITRDGRDTNPAISQCLGELIEKGNSQWGELEKKYKEFCAKLSLVPNGNERKFWKPISG